MSLSSIYNPDIVKYAHVVQMVRKNGKDNHIVKYIIPEGIKLIPEGLYPDYPPSFSPRNISGGRKVESLICIVRVKKVASSGLFFGFFSVFGGFRRILAVLAVFGLSVFITVQIN